MAPIPLCFDSELFFAGVSLLVCVAGVGAGAAFSFADIFHACRAQKNNSKNASCPIQAKKVATCVLVRLHYWLHVQNIEIKTLSCLVFWKKHAQQRAAN